MLYVVKCPICKTDLSDGHKHSADEARRYLKKANQPAQLGKRSPRKPNIRGGQNIPRQSKGE